MPSTRTPNSRQAPGSGDSMRRYPSELITVIVLASRKPITSRLNSSNFSSWAQCPQRLNTCSCARRMSLSATSAPSSGFTRSSRPQISSTSCRSRCASRHSIPSSAVAGSKNEAPSEAIAASASGSLAAANRSLTSSSVISRWS